MKIVDLDYDKLVRDLRSNLVISSCVLVDSRPKYRHIVDRLLSDLHQYEDIDILRNCGSFYNHVLKSHLSVSLYRNYDDLFQSVCGRRLDHIYIDYSHDDRTMNLLQSRIRRPMSLPNIDGLTGITIFENP